MKLQQLIKEHPIQMTASESDKGSYYTVLKYQGRELVFFYCGIEKPTIEEALTQRLIYADEMKGFMDYEDFGEWLIASNNDKEEAKTAWDIWVDNRRIVLDIQGFLGQDFDMFYDAYTEVL